MYDCVRTEWTPDHLIPSSSPTGVQLSKRENSDANHTEQLYQNDPGWFGQMVRVRRRGWVGWVGEGGV